MTDTTSLVLTICGICAFVLGVPILIRNTERQDDTLGAKFSRYIANHLDKKVIARLSKDSSGRWDWKRDPHDWSDDQWNMYFSALDSSSRAEYRPLFKHLEHLGNSYDALSPKDKEQVKALGQGLGRFVLGDKFDRLTAPKKEEKKENKPPDLWT